MVFKTGKKNYKKQKFCFITKYHNRMDIQLLNLCTLNDSFEFVILTLMFS